MEDGEKSKKIKDEEKKVHRLINTSITSTLDKSKQNRNDNQEHYRRVLSWNERKLSDQIHILHYIPSNEIKWDRNLDIPERNISIKSFRNVQKLDFHLKMKTFWGI